VEEKNNVVSLSSATSGFPRNRPEQCANGGA